MKHIVIDARMLRTSSGRYVERLLHYLQQIDSKHRYTVLLKPEDIDGWEPTNENFTKVASPYIFGSFGEQISLLWQIFRLKPDLVHFTFVQQPVLYRGRVVTTMHDLTAVRFRNPNANPVIFMLKQMVYRWMNKYVANKSKRIITPTHFVRDDVAQYTGVHPVKISVTYEAADKITEVAEPILELGGQKFIMYVGRVQPHKNIQRLVEAFMLLRDKHPDIKLVLAGKKDSQYEQIANTIPEEGRAAIVFTGFISEGQLRWLYENTAAYVFPSLSEGFGLPPLEAMMHGAPVVCSNATCLPEVNKDGAVYFDPKDVNDMADKINSVLTDAVLVKKLVKRGHKVAAGYSWQRMAKETLRIYKDLLQPHHK